MASSRGESEATAGTFAVAGIELDREDSRKAKMLYDYEATDDSQLTIAVGEVNHFAVDSVYFVHHTHLLHPLHTPGVYHDPSAR